MPQSLSKICLTAFYFGKFNNYFHLWLNSCRANSSVDFMLFTDNNELYNYPDNVKKITLTFNDFRERCRSKYDFPISMNNPYHICDYVPAFGDIFANELADYDFWGHCDIDLVFGDIRKFIPETILQNYDKISWRGHFSLYKNNLRVNQIYKSTHLSHEIYKTIFTNPTNSLFAFEENEINPILEHEGLKIYKGLYFADLKTCTNNFEMMHFSESFQEKNKEQIFEYNNGKLFRHFNLKGELRSEEMMYIHFLKRPMSLENNPLDIDHFLILPNYFAPFEEITLSKVLIWAKKRFYFSYYLERLNFKYYKKRKESILNIQLFNERYNHLNRAEYNVVIDNHFEV